jgi:hypothetical protein
LAGWAGIFSVQAPAPGAAGRPDVAAEQQPSGVAAVAAGPVLLLAAVSAGRLQPAAARAVGRRRAAAAAEAEAVSALQALAGAALAAAAL